MVLLGGNGREDGVTDMSATGRQTIYIYISPSLAPELKRVAVVESRGNAIRQKWHGPTLKL